MPWIECGTGSATWVECPEPTGSEIELEELDSGLLAYHIAGDPGSPFDVNNWDGPSNDPGVVAGLDGNGNFQIATSSANRYMLYTPVASRSKMLLQVRGFTATLGALIEPVIHIQSVTALSETMVGVEAEIGQTTTDDFKIVEQLNGSDRAILHDFNIGNKVANRFYRFTLFGDGNDIEAHDHKSAFTHSLTTLDVVLGQAGLGAIYNSGERGYSHFFLMKDKVVTVINVPTGYTAEVQDIDGTVLRTGNESGGQIEVDILGLDYDGCSETQQASEDPTGPEPRKLVVKDGSGEEIVSDTPTTALWGGARYGMVFPIWTECP